MNPNRTCWLSLNGSVMVRLSGPIGSMSKPEDWVLSRFWWFFLAEQTEIKTAGKVLIRTLYLFRTTAAPEGRRFHSALLLLTAPGKRSCSLDQRTPSGKESPWKPASEQSDSPVQNRLQSGPKLLHQSVDLSLRTQRTCFLLMLRPGSHLVLTQIYVNPMLVPRPFTEKVVGLNPNVL